MRIVQANFQRVFGGAERHVASLASALAERGHEVFVATHPESQLSEAARQAGLETLCVRASSQSDLRALPGLIQSLGRLRPDVLHLHTPREYVLGLLAGRAAGVGAIVLTRHNLGRVRPIMRAVYARADATICLTELMRESLRAQGVAESRLVALRGGVETAPFVAASHDAARRAALRAEWGLPDASVLFGVVGRLVDGKGVEVFLSALSGLPPQAAGVIVGEGERRAALEGSPGSSRARFVGFRSDPPAVMAALDVLVLPSTGPEVLPLTLMEAMAARRSVIATRVGSVPELIVENENGLLVPPGDADSLGAAMQSLTCDPALRARLAVAGQAHVCEHFTLERLTDETIGLYDRLLAGGRRG